MKTVLGVCGNCGKKCTLYPIPETNTGQIYVVLLHRGRWPWTCGTSGTLTTPTNPSPEKPEVPPG